MKGHLAFYHSDKKYMNLMLYLRLMINDKESLSNFVSFFGVIVALFSIHQIRKFSRTPLGLTLASLTLGVGLINDKALQEGIHRNRIDTHEKNSNEVSDHCHKLYRDNSTMTWNKGSV